MGFLEQFYAVNIDLKPSRLVATKLCKSGNCVHSGMGVYYAGF